MKIRGNLAVAIHATIAPYAYGTVLQTLHTHSDAGAAAVVAGLVASPVLIMPPEKYPLSRLLGGMGVALVTGSLGAKVWAVGAATANPVSSVVGEALLGASIGEFVNDGVELGRRLLKRPVGKSPPGASLSA